MYYIGLFVVSMPLTGPCSASLSERGQPSHAVLFPQRPIAVSAGEQQEWGCGRASGGCGHLKGPLCPACRLACNPSLQSSLPMLKKCEHADYLPADCFYLWMVPGQRDNCASGQPTSTGEGDSGAAGGAQN